MNFPVKCSRVVFQSGRATRLGQIFHAEYIHHGRGVPLEPLRIFGQYALVYVLGEGAAYLKQGDQPLRTCGQGDLIFVYPDVPLSYGPQRGSKWSEFYVSFGGPIFDLWRRAGFLDPAKSLRHLPRIRRWLPRLEAVADPTLPDSPRGMLQRICRLQQFLVDISEDALPAGDAHPWIEAAQRELVEHPTTPPEAIARGLGLSYDTFRKEFARVAGLPPAKYRQQRLMDQARWLVTERRLNNKQIAETLGFCDEFHFSRRFRQVTGQSPRAFRTHAQG